MNEEATGENSEQDADASSSVRPSRLKATLLASGEGRLLVAGVAVAFAYTFWLGVRLLVSPGQAQILVGMTATQVMFGRAAGMAFGYSLGLGHGMVIPICMIIETILVLTFYPLFVFSWRHLVVIKALGNVFERAHKVAQTHKPLVQRYGIIGLFVFVWFPFWLTGPVVGCIIGFLLGLRVWVNITAVLAGTYVAIVGWALLLKQLHDSVASYSSYAAMVLMALLVIIIIVGNLLHSTIRNNRNKQT
jgi:uncharacterized membrane protein